MKRTIILSVLCLIFVSNSFGNNIPPDLINAFSDGNAPAVSSFFNSTLELTLFDKEEIYSKTQAERILKDFFAKNQPTSFKLIHQGGKESSKYAIGNLKTNNNIYRITFLLKTVNSKVFIHQLRIEQDNVE